MVKNAFYLHPRMCIYIFFLSFIRIGHQYQFELYTGIIIDWLTLFFGGFFFLLIEDVKKMAIFL